MALLDFFKKKQIREKLTRRQEGDSRREDKTPKSDAPSGPAGASKIASSVLERPHITEKTVRSSDAATYVFRVASHATRPAVRRAVEDLYRVRVRRVNLLSVPSRAVKHWKRSGERPGFRKALVTLEKGQTIEFV